MNTTAMRVEYDALFARLKKGHPQPLTAEEKQRMHWLQTRLVYQETERECGSHNRPRGRR